MKMMPTPSLGEPRFSSPQSPYDPEDLLIPSDIEWRGGQAPQELMLFEKAGARSRLFFDPKQTRAGLVTCGGLCPGLNNVIRSVFRELVLGYGVETVFGFRNGYRGLDPNRGDPPILLNHSIVSGIHKRGGTILGTSRGPVDIGIAVDFLLRERINILFCIGGDGTLRGGNALYEEARRRGHHLAVVGIPKTIDNDVPFVTRTFGYTTAVEQAHKVIDSAHTEASSVLNGVGLVKLMGRDAGFIAAAAAVVSQDVNFCLIPELPFQLQGEKGFLAALKHRLQQRRHAVVVVAEGAGQNLLGPAMDKRDASGNPIHQDIGVFLRETITAYFKAENMEMTLRYFDPGYQIRGAAANTEDAALSDRFARLAVHAGMAGKTGLVIGHVNGHFIHVPIGVIADNEKRVNLGGELWQSALSATRQPVRFE